VTEPTAQPGAQYTQSHVPQTVVKQLRQRAAWDVAISIVLIVFTNVSFILGAIFALLGTAFTSTCRMGEYACETVSAQSVPFAVGAILAFIALLGSVLTIVLLVRRRRGWWLALTTLLIVVIGWVVGFLLFAAALTSR
jgi:hypothetical protein